MSASSFPCPNVLDCPCDDSPFFNLSAEGRDSNPFFGIFYECGNPNLIPVTCQSEVSLEAAKLCAARSCGGHNIFFSASKRCCCPTDATICYSAPAGSFIALSQAAADALADAFACDVAFLMCDNPNPELFRNVPQTCACATNAAVTYTVPAGAFIATTQAEADALALAFACAVVNTLVCQGIVLNPVAYNAEQRCSAPCPDGIGLFFFIVPAGTFSGTNQAEADEKAHSFACNQAFAKRICLSVPAICPCLNSFASYEMPITFGTGPFTLTIESGFLPAGMTMFLLGDKVVLQGTPVLSGQGSFILLITNGFGVYRRTIGFSVLEITTTTLTDFEVGVAYSFQLAATGGSGVYYWRISYGSLPAGLTMNLSGLITGTPTSAISSSFSVEMIDGACQAADKHFFTPQVRLVGSSTRTLAEVKGFSEFIVPSTPPKKYMVKTYTPSMTGDDAGGDPVLMDEASSAYLTGQNGIFFPPIKEVAKWFVTASGVTQINAAGTVITSATIQMYSSCPFGTFFPPVIDPTDPPYQYLVRGWCVPYDQSQTFPNPPYPIICDTAAEPPEPMSGGSLEGAVGNGTTSLAPFHGRPNYTSQTHGENFSSGQQTLGFFPNPTYMPLYPNIGAGALDGYAAVMQWKHSYTIDLAVEYTDALALANAVITHSNSLVAENFPRTTGFVSRFTAVTFQLRLSNLVFGESYEVSVDFRDSDFVVTTQTYVFTAIDDVHVISDSIPNPAAGETITARNPRVVYKV